MTGFRSLLASCIVTLALASFAHAGAGGDGTRGGGNAVVCYSASGSSQIQSVSFFDYWEEPKELISPLPIDLGGPALTVAEKIDMALDRLRKFDPTRAQSYSARATEILADLDRYFDDADFSTPNDDNSRFEPAPPCVKEPFAIQVNHPEPLQRKFVFNRAIYQLPQVSNDVRAGLILHEIIYSEVLDHGMATSDGVRYLNYLLATHFFDTASFQEYSDIVQHIGLPFPSVQTVPGQTLPLFYSTEKSSVDPLTEKGEKILTIAAPYHWEDSLRSIDLNPGDLVFTSADQKAIIGIRKLTDSGSRTLNVLGQQLSFVTNTSAQFTASDKSDKDVEFFEDGNVKSFISSSDFSAPLLGKSVKFRGISYDCGKQVDERQDIRSSTESYDSRVWLSKDGLLQGACLAEPTAVSLGVNSIEITDYLFLYQDGSLETVFLNKPITGSDAKGSAVLDFRVLFERGQIVYRDPEVFKNPRYQNKYLIAGDDLNASLACRQIFHADDSLRYETVTGVSDPSLLGSSIYTPARPEASFPPNCDSAYPQTCPVISELECYTKRLLTLR